MRIDEHPGCIGHSRMTAVDDYQTAESLRVDGGHGPRNWPETAVCDQQRPRHANSTQSFENLGRVRVPMRRDQHSPQKRDVQSLSHRVDEVGVRAGVFQNHYGVSAFRPGDIDG